MLTKDPKSNNINYRSEDPLVSVIIPTYNHAPYLGEAIQSVLRQTYENYEIIVVDDGSTDNTREVVAKFGEKIRYIQQDNQGLSAARNTGIRAAKGELIGLLDADDLYEPEFMETLVPILESDSEIDGVYCSARTVDIENNPLPQLIGRGLPPNQFRNSLLRGGFFPPLCMFARKYCYEELGLFDLSFQGCADWDIWLRMSTRYHIVGIDRTLTRYRIEPNSMSHDIGHMLDDRTRVLQKYFADDPDDQFQWTHQHKQAFGYNYLRTSIEFLQAENQGKADQYLRQAFDIYPELASDFDVFYRLGLGGQPMGYRGNFSSLDLDKNAYILMAMLDALMDDPKIAFQLKDYRKTAYANAFLALGLLNYGAQRFDEARRLLLRAIAIEPGFAFKQNNLPTLAKSLIGPAGIEWFRALKQKGPI